MDDANFSILKRNDSTEEVQANKILNMLSSISKSFSLNIKTTQLCMKILDQLHDEIPSSKIMDL